MKDYSAMSDFEINKEVAYSKIGGDWLLEPTDERKFTFYNLDVETKNTVELPDYCNNPADAWPIIIANRIMMNPYCADDLWKCEVPCADDGFMKTYSVSYDKNPLRAAMIVYLQMNDK